MAEGPPQEELQLLSGLHSLHPAASPEMAVSHLSLVKAVGRGAAGLGQEGQAAVR